jgi:hypothetical protein
LIVSVRFFNELALDPCLVVELDTKVSIIVFCGICGAFGNTSVSKDGKEGCFFEISRGCIVVNNDNSCFISHFSLTS